MKMRAPLLATLLTAATMAAAADPAAAENHEIAELLAVLGASSCQFYRNGSWHDGRAAETHLQRKYDYLRKRGLAESAEQFIANGATKSSLSGTPYQVKCGNADPVSSAQWLGEQLALLRSRRGGAEPSRPAPRARD